MQTIEIELSDPIEGIPAPDGSPTTIKRIVLRAPRLREYAEIGDLIMPAKSANGSIAVMEIDGVFDRYIDALLVEPQSQALARNISLVDSMRLKDALSDFFSKSRATVAGEAKKKSGV